MRYTDPKQRTETAPDPAADNVPERLRREIADLQRRLRDYDDAGLQTGAPEKVWRPSAITMIALALAAVVLAAVAFFAGYLPLQKRQTQIASEAGQQEQSLPRVQVFSVSRTPNPGGIELPGTIQAITEAPILARADGYIKRRLVDIGDRVTTGQVLAEIEAPELDQQVIQAQAAVQQAEAALEQASANREQGSANLELARITAGRWKLLAAQGVVSQQDNDQYQAQLQAQQANVQALEKAVAAQRANIAAAQANVARLEQVRGYTQVRAPFDGVITVRNVDAGALVTTGATLLYRIAQTGTLRAYINVPQSDANAIHTGQQARLNVSTFPSRFFAGTVTRTAHALDATSRTLLVEVDVPNPGGVLMPGMYAQVNLGQLAGSTSLIIPSDTLITRSDGSQVAVVGSDDIVHLRKIDIARDYGDKIEVASGLREGDRIVLNPGDKIRDGAKVDVSTEER